MGSLLQWEFKGKQKFVRYQSLLLKTCKNEGVVKKILIRANYIERNFLFHDKIELVDHDLFVIDSCRFLCDAILTSENNS